MKKLKDINEMKFTKNGFALLRSFLDETSCDLIRSEIEATINSGVSGACIRPNNTLHLLQFDHEIIRIVFGKPERLKKLKKQVAAKDLRWISGYISSKEPFSPPLWWHQDWWCWNHEISFRKDAAQVALLIYMQSTTLKNGALRIIPSSHHSHHHLNKFRDERNSQENEYELDHPLMSASPDQFSPSIQKGDAIVIDYRLLHGTEGNQSAFRRDCIILNFTPNWVCLPQEIKSHLAGHMCQPKNITQFSSKDCSYFNLLPEFSGEKKIMTVSLFPSD
ncbi:phytanoyl-CoA dioxygenase family protein [Pedobacter sp. ISL-68]|uniref:phytanoyl-CoA dioxygenase family protein n=1 Tax=unclassified Pedobacter TaxID=2628915 RepID=UPI001BE5DA6B|nr:MULTISPECIES: phytanoyl-CoA dioxygenase family protein [unclassified Pedobacter]MBT2564684.1 phytanoyl-CoA dioxygenase family protein [Pedobacter sp. ISL-64]MBT2592427.1 phytanoyl-CoA dioxygenase family protein [Pedobacter sp. ISL-68]